MSKVDARWGSQLQRDKANARWSGLTAEERIVERARGRGEEPKPRCKCGKHTAQFAQLVGLKCRLTKEWGKRLSDY